MAIQVSIPKESVPFGVSLAKAYVRITSVLINWSDKTMMFQASVWADKESRDTSRQAIMQVPAISIRKEPTPATHRIKTDAKGQQVIENGEPVLEQTSPAFPSFEEVELLIGQAILANQDYRKVGYDLLKKLDLVKNNSPSDV